MQKTKTKRTIWTILLVVAVVTIAAIFYWFVIENNKDDAPVLEDINFDEPVKASELEEAPTIEDVEEESIETNSLEYISEFHETKGTFNALGISWDEVNAKVSDIIFYIRVKNNEVVSEWYQVDKIDVGKNGEATSYAAETPVLAEGQGYQYKINFSDTENEVRNIEINIINTSADASYSDFFDKLTSLFKEKKAVAATSIISRSSWSCGAPNNTQEELQAYADSHDINIDSEDIYWPAYNASKSTKFIVHHTAGTNNPSNPAAAVRAVWVYHTYSREWGDIGYNYLVDQYGKIYEGRYGGDHVVAGHAAPYNYDEANNAVSVGVSVLGDFSTYIPSSTILNGLGNIIGYKAFLYNINPTKASNFEDKYTYNVAGHRNYTATACPGAELYARLGTVRTIAYNNMKTYGHKIDNLVIDNHYPVVGETINGTFNITNVKDETVTLDSLKIVGRRDGVNEDFTGVAIELEAGATYTYEKSKTITTAGDYDFYVKYLEGGAWYNVIATEGTASIELTAYPTAADVKMTSSLVTTPEFANSVNGAYGSFYLKNYGAQPAVIPVIKLVVYDSLGSKYDYHQWRMDNVVINGGQTFKFYDKGILPAGKYTIDVDYQDTDNVWHSSFIKEDGVIDNKEVGFYEGPADPKISESLKLSDTNILSGNPVTATFKVTNYGNAPVRFESLKVAVRRDNTYNYDYSGIYGEVLCPDGYEDDFCDYSGTLNYSATQTFVDEGNYTMWIAAKIDGTWVTLSSSSSVTTTSSLTVETINYSKLVLKIFTTNDTTPAIGQPTYVNYRINNYNNYPVTLARVKAVGRLDNGVNVDFPGYSNVTIPAGRFRDFSERKVIGSYRVHTYYIAYYDAGSWHKPVEAAKNKIVAVPHIPNLKIVKSMIINPVSGTSGSSFTATFGIKNYEGGTVYIKTLKVADRVGTTNTDYPGVRAGIAPGATYNYSQSRIQTLGIDHKAFTAFRYNNGTWAKPIAVSGVYTYKYYKVTAIDELYVNTVNYVGNLLLPATSGLVAREQHLYLNSAEAILGRTWAATQLHYTNTNPPLAVRVDGVSDMAGGYGAFGAVNDYVLPATNEKYYITMRWNYVTWYEGDLGNPDEMYCGSKYEFYSKAYYNSYKYDGEYCVPKTYTKNPNYGMQKEYNKKKVLVTNKANGKKVIASILEAGPAIWTGRVGGLSPEGMYYLGAATNNNLYYEWANQSAILGPVN